MTDSLSTAIRSIEEVFSGSMLAMDVYAHDSGVAEAAGTPSVMGLLTVLSMVLAIICLRDYFSLAPRLFDCLWRWRGNFLLSASIPSQKMRNKVAAVSILPFTLMLLAFDIVRPELIFVMMVVKYLIYLPLYRNVRRSPETFREAAICLSNYFIVMVVLMAASLGVLKIFGTSFLTIRTILIVEILSLYLLYLVRKIQILESVFSHLQVFSYLCALEIVPCGLLTAAIISL